jgi:hypothetical protein
MVLGPLLRGTNHKRNLVNNTGGGGGNLPWVLETLFYKWVKSEKKTGNLSFFCPFLFVIIQISKQINYS